MMARRIGVVALAGMLLASISMQGAFAHEFTGSESAQFLGLVEKVRAHLGLIEQNIEDDNLELAQIHAERAADSLDEDTLAEIAERNERIAEDLPATIEELEGILSQASPEEQQAIQISTEAGSLLEEAVAVRIDPEQLTNATTQALTAANVADEVLAQYSAAFGMQANGDHDTHSDSMEGNMTMTTSMEESMEIVDMASLQMAQQLAGRLGQMYTELEALAPEGSEEPLGALEGAIDELRAAVDQEAPLDEVTVIIHNQVHQNLGEAFGLELEGQDGADERIMLEGTTEDENYVVEVEWVSADIGEENMFTIMIMDEEGNHLEDAMYDIMLLRDDQVLQETVRTDQTVEEQHYTFDEAGSYILRIENIEGESTVEIPMQVVPEFPAVLVAAVAAGIGVAMFAGLRLKRDRRLGGF